VRAPPPGGACLVKPHTCSEPLPALPAGRAGSQQIGEPPGAATQEPQ